MRDPALRTGNPEMSKTDPRAADILMPEIALYKWCHGHSWQTVNSCNRFCVDPWQLSIPRLISAVAVLDSSTYRAASCLQHLHPSFLLLLCLNAFSTAPWILFSLSRQVQLRNAKDIEPQAQCSASEEWESKRPGPASGPSDGPFGGTCHTVPHVSPLGVNPGFPQ